MDTDIKKLEALLVEGKHDEAKEMIADIVAAKLSHEDRGAALLGLAQVYLDISNSIDGQYKAALEEAIEGMKMINSAESKTDDKIRIAELRDQLNK